MSEIRHAADRWTIIAPKRERRPGVGAQTGDGRGACPFCPGNERLLPSIIAETPDPSGSGWQTRVVPNKFPALEPDAAAARRGNDPYEGFGGFGHHEVIIEDPGHDRDLAVASDDALGAVIRTYRDRYRTLMEDPRIRSVIVFRNYGRHAGASLGHPHSQVAALGLVPPAVARRDEEEKRHYRDAGRCLTCDVVERERADALRVVAENGQFIAHVPFAAATPYEVWIVPLRHRADFSGVSDGEIAELGAMLGIVLRAFRERLEDPQYNLVIHSAPKGLEAAAHLHWSVQIMPRLAVPAGFELGSGMRINPSIPELDASVLARAIDDLA